MTKKEKTLLILSLVVAGTFGVTQNAFAMHIMEGYLPKTHCLFYAVLCIPFLAMGVIKINRLKSQNNKIMLLLAMVGAYAFVLSALKLPSVTGSSSHPTGTGLGAIIFGPWVMSVLGIIVLLFQAIFLAHGGVSTLGANTFSMAIAGPFISYVVFVLFKKMKLNKNMAIFAAAFLGDLFTYCLTSFQLGFAYPDAVGGVGASVIKFLGVFAITQVPLAIVEGLLTVAVMIGLEAYASQELREVEGMKRGAVNE